MIRQEFGEESMSRERCLNCMLGLGQPEKAKQAKSKVKSMFITLI
jgi:hypothetical protein